MKKIKMAMMATAAIVGTVSAFATHKKTVVTPPCSQLLPNFYCADFVPDLHCCKDDLTSHIYMGPLRELEAKH